MNNDIADLDAAIRTCETIIEQLKRAKNDDKAYMPKIQAVKLGIDIGMIAGRRAERERIRNSLGL